MKFLLSLILLIAFFKSIYTQEALYIKYEVSNYQTQGETEYTDSVLGNSILEMAIGENRIWKKSMDGSDLSVTTDYNKNLNQVTIIIDGMMGQLVYQGQPDDLQDDKTETQNITFEYFEDTKKISGYSCKKAISTDSLGNRSTYWYTEEIEKSSFMNHTPDGLPGFALSMEIESEDGSIITYSPIIINETADISDYEISIPNDVQIIDLKTLNGE